MLSEKDRDTMAAGLSLAAEFGGDKDAIAEAFGITDWNDRPYVLATFRSVVDEMAPERQIALKSILAEFLD